MPANVPAEPRLQLRSRQTPDATIIHCRGRLTGEVTHLLITEV